MNLVTPGRTGEETGAMIGRGATLRRLGSLKERRNLQRVTKDPVEVYPLRTPRKPRTPSIGWDLAAVKGQPHFKDPLGYIIRRVTHCSQALVVSCAPT